jgi:hypothetical protein
MARSEHVSKLKEGARVWNAWRRENPRAEPQLADLNLPVGLRQFGLAQGGPVDLSQADLCRAALEHATLIDADLTGAYLLQANLAHARLTGADLTGANLSDARLDHADLNGAQLAEATLCGSSLKGARNLTQAQIEKAYGDEDTRLPAGLVRPARWRKDTTPRANQLARRAASKPDGRKFDPYAVLGVPRTAALAEIRAVYLQLVKELHPDGRELDPMAGELLKAVNKAYQDLKARARQPASQPPPRSFSRASTFFLVSFLGSSLILLALVGGLYYTGVFGEGRPPRLAADPRAGSGEQHAAPAPAEAAAKPDPAQLAAARAAADDAAFLEAEREATSASLHRYLGRYSNGRHARQAAAALPAVVNTEIALAQALEGQTGTSLETSRAAMRHYLDHHPDGRLAPEVERKLNTIAAAESRRVADHEAWAEAQRLGTLEGLRRYLTAYPRGENAAYAEKALAALEASAARRRADQAAWSEAAREGSKAGLHRYLTAYPDGDHAADARTTIAAIEASEARHKADRAAWDRASQDGGKPALTRYLSAHPDGDHAAAARQAIAGIEASEARQTADEAAWAKAAEEGSKEAFNHYLATHPEGVHAELARQTVRALEASETRHARDRVARAQELRPEAAQSGWSPPSEMAPEQDPLGGSAKLAPPPASSEASQEERLRDDANWLRAQRRHSKAAYAAYLLTHPNGRHAKEARASLAELQAPPAKLRPAASAKGFKQITQAYGESPRQGDPPASQKWQSADEPFIGSDGRIRQR